MKEVFVFCSIRFLLKSKTSRSAAHRENVYWKNFLRTTCKFRQLVSSRECLKEKGKNCHLISLGWKIELIVIYQKYIYSYIQCVPYYMCRFIVILSYKKRPTHLRCAISLNQAQKSRKWKTIIDRPILALRFSILSCRVQISEVVSVTKCNMFRDHERTEWWLHAENIFR